MWAAQTLMSGGDADSQPWWNADHLYTTIDNIDDINVSWQTFEIKYNGPQPPLPPLWMTQKYTLLVRDIRALFHQQMRMKDFDDSRFNKVPYRQYNNKRERVRSNIMSADWAWQQSVCQVPCLFFSCLHLLIGHPCTRSYQSWRNVRTISQWKRQNDCFSCYWASGIPPGVYEPL